MPRLPASIPLVSTPFKIIDFFIFLFILALLSLIISFAAQWTREVQPSVEISLEISNLPAYSINSLLRIFIAYALSLLFSIWFGYAANRSRLHEKIMIPLLDVLQSIPVLSFLPVVALALVAVFPGRRIGLELTSILLIFTGQAWNLAFSYYNSINTLPRELEEVASVFRHNRFTKFLHLDLPFSAVGLVWNSMMSVSGGWFFLIACEMFVLSDRDFRLPGIGSYIQTAATKGDIKSLLFGIGTMVFIIVLLDFLLWRPLVAWSQKFRFDTVSFEEEKQSFVLNSLRRSTLSSFLLSEFSRILAKAESWYGRKESLGRGRISGAIRKTSFAVIGIGALVLVAYFLVKSFLLLSSLDFSNYLDVLVAAFYSLLRTSAAIFLATLWTVPLGVYIGLHARAARLLQPIIQIVAAVPATALFPVLMLFIINLGGGLGVGAIFLMLLGTQWYVLFNVIAGASAIPVDLVEAANLYGISGWTRWKILILPGIFPYLIIGLITATGGAWNATIVAEYVVFGGEAMSTVGLGSLISKSTAAGDFALLLLSTMTMALVVVSINRLLWKRLFALAQEKYRLD